MALLDIRAPCWAGAWYRFHSHSSPSRINCCPVSCMPRNRFQYHKGVHGFHFCWSTVGGFDCSHRNRSDCEKRHIITKYLSGDGNFRLVHEVNGNKDPDDVSLVNGGAYFVEWADFEAYLKVASLRPEEVNIIYYFAYLVLIQFICRNLLVIVSRLQ
jgi:hypothetical protein